MKVQNSNFYALVFLFIQNFFLVSLQSLNLADLKGTYDVLKPEYQHCSPVHGAVWWETDLVRKYYKFGDASHATVKLIHELFHEVDGSFGLTILPAKYGAHFSVEMIGEML